MSAGGNNGLLPWGSHFCQFYGEREDLVDTLVPYFKAGLDNIGEPLDLAVRVADTAERFAEEFARARDLRPVPGAGERVRVCPDDRRGPRAHLRGALSGLRMG